MIFSCSNHGTNPISIFEVLMAASNQLHLPHIAQSKTEWHSLFARRLQCLYENLRSGAFFTLRGFLIPPAYKASFQGARSPPAASSARRGYKAVLRSLGLRQHFAAVLGGECLPERKPSAAPLLEAMRRCRFAGRTDECLMVGDSAVDILSGKAAGVRTCGFTGGFRGREELEAAGADYLIDDIGQLVGLASAPRASPRRTSPAVPRPRLRP